MLHYIPILDSVCPNYLRIIKDWPVQGANYRRSDYQHVPFNTISVNRGSSVSVATTSREAEEKGITN